MPTLDPETQRLVDLGRQANKPPFEALTPEQARDAYAASWDVLQPVAEQVASVREFGIPGAQGELRLRVYRGQGTDNHEKLPCMVYLHGGGWVIGNLESHDRLCRRIANTARICVVAVDYRLAPEHPYPAALEDAQTAWRWVHENTARLSVVSGRIGIGGDSAGGGLAAVVALLGRDNALPRAAYQALIYPVVDLKCDSASYRNITGVPLTAPTMKYFIDHYVPKESDRLEWRVSPLRAGTFAGLPPALVLTVANDPLCDEGRAYARRLEEEGVRVTALHLSDQMHGLLLQGKLVRAANTVGDFVGHLIGQALYHGPATTR